VPTVDATRIANALTATREVFNLTQTASVPSPTPTPTNTLPPTTPPTLDATPEFITAAPRTPVFDDLGLITPLPPQESATPEERFEATPTPPVQPTVELVVPLPPTVSLDDLPVGIPPLTNTSALAFALSTTGGLSQGAFGLLDNVNLFARNPVNPNQYVATNGAGVFYIVNNGVPFRPNTSPFSEFEPRTVEENQYLVEYIRWSPNGAWVGFIIDGERHPNATAADGMHVYNPQSGESFQLLRDAPYNGHPGTQLGGARQWLFDTASLEWSPDSELMLVRARVGDPADANNLGGLMVLHLGHDPNREPPSRICDYGSWSADGSRIIVSGRCSGQESIIGTTDRGLGDFQVIFNAAQNGYWVQNAVQRPNGQIVALGRQGDRNGPMRIIDSAGNFLTGDIGVGPPERVEWSPDRSSVLLIVGGRYYIAQVNGFVSDITSSVGSARAVNWVSGGLPEGARPSLDGPTSQGSTAPSGEIPSGVVEGSIYSAGQQLQVASESLNLRDNPGLNSTSIGSLSQGAYVVVLAGPASIDGFFWWFVQTANRQTGWIAGEINGFSTLHE